MKPFRILNLSDLHFGSCSSRVADLRRSAEPRECATALVAMIEAGLAEQGMLLTNGEYVFDALVLSGDLTCYGEPDGLLTAEHFVDQLVNSKGWVSLDGVMSVPGNHDIFRGPREEVKLQFDGWPKQWAVPRVEDRQKEYRRFLDNVRASSSLPIVDTLGAVNLFMEPRIALIGMDSCRVESWTESGIGYVGLDQLFSLIEEIEAHEQRGLPWRKFAFLHHHPLPVGQPSIGNVIGHEISYLIDAEAIMDWLRRCHVDFVFHGHCHANRVRKTENSHPMPGRVLSAGSVGVTRRACEGRKHHFFVVDIFPRRLRVFDFLCPEGGRFSLDQSPYDFPLSAPRRIPSDKAKRVAGWVESREEAASYLAIMDEWPTVIDYFSSDTDRRNKAYKDFGWQLRDDLSALWNADLDADAFDSLFRELAFHLWGESLVVLSEYKRLLDGPKRIRFSEFLLRHMFTRYPDCRRSLENLRTDAP